MIRLSVFLVCIVLLAHPSFSQVVIPPQLVGSVDTPDDAFDVVLAGQYALVPDYASGVHVIDISNPAVPFIAGSHNTPGFSIQVAVDGGHAFVADHAVGGLRVLDASALPTLAPLSSYTTGDAAVAVAARDNLVAVGYVEGYLELVDVSAVTPASVSVFDTPGVPRHLVFNGHRLYVVDNSFGLIVLDISDPAMPVKEGEFATDGRPVGLTKREGLVYLADGSNGLRTIDVGQPSQPQDMTSIALPGPAVKVALSGAYAVVADHVAGGLQVVNASDPYQLIHLGGYVTGFYAHGVAARDDLAYLADGKGLQIFRVFDTASAVAPDRPANGPRIGVFPNPFNPATTIRITLERSARVILSIHTVTGEPVDTIVNSRLPAGDHDIQWNGKMRLDGEVAAGVYYCRLEVDGSITSHKMVLLK